jgi:hypothetical protein
MMQGNSPMLYVPFSSDFVDYSLAGNFNSRTRFYIQYRKVTREEFKQRMNEIERERTGRLLK